MPVAPSPPELLYTLAQTKYVFRQIESAAFFEDWNQFVELRPGVRSGNHDANGMEEFFSFASRLSLHLVDKLFETFGCELSGFRRFLLQQLESKSREHVARMRPA